MVAFRNATAVAGANSCITLVHMLCYEGLQLWAPAMAGIALQIYSIQYNSVWVNSLFANQGSTSQRAKRGSYPLQICMDGPTIM